ncbi:MAG: phage major capsid protein, partial [Anaerolineae bacterium]|nr:phage major capsid protein [Anaerolineae bacterium]
MNAPPTAVKMLDEDGGRVGGYLAVWGDPQRRDLHGEYFTPETDFGLDWYAQRPALYQHGQDDRLKAAPIGVIDTLRRDEVGLWAEAQLVKRGRYLEAVRELVRRGALSWSSGSLPHLVKTGADGRIERWVVVEGSLTPTPAEPRLTTDVQTMKALYDALALTLPAWATQTDDDETMEEEPPMTDVLDTPRKRLPSAVDDATKGAPEPLIAVGSPYDELNALDMLHGCVLLGGARAAKGVSERYANALAHKVRRAGLSALKADELSHTAQNGFGAEWVPALWSDQLWRKARQDNVILPLFSQIEMPSSPFHVPTEGVDPTVYYVPETRNEAQLALTSSTPALPDSKLGTDKLTLTAKKLALRVGFSAELIEDAVLPVLGIYREQAARAIADAIDHVLLNGDETTGAGNINDVNNDFDASARFRALDGLRHLPLVANTALVHNFAGAATLDKLRTVRFKLPVGRAARPSDLAWVVDGNTYAKLLGLPEFLTMDKAGAQATALTGQLGFIDGIPVLVSAELSLSRADGQFEVGGDNTKGTALLVYRPGWLVGTRRRIAVSVDYLPYYDAYQMTAT